MKVADVLSFFGTWLRLALTENLGLKALSLAFALGLFFYQKGQQDQQQRTVPVGVVMRLLDDRHYPRRSFESYHLRWTSV